MPRYTVMRESRLIEGVTRDNRGIITPLNSFATMAEADTCILRIRAYKALPARERTFGQYGGRSYFIVAEQ
jgi:hypothetical protein